MQKAQGNKCAVCERDFKGTVVACVDHDHTTGHIRGALCRACNRLEGQVKNRILMAGGKADPLFLLRKLLAYLEYYATPRTTYLHPDHKTDAEKRLATLEKQRKRRAALRAQKQTEK